MQLSDVSQASQMVDSALANNVLELTNSEFELHLLQVTSLYANLSDVSQMVDSALVANFLELANSGFVTNNTEEAITQEVSQIKESVNDVENIITMTL